MQIRPYQLEKYLNNGSSVRTWLIAGDEMYLNLEYAAQIQTSITQKTKIVRHIWYLEDKPKGEEIGRAVFGQGLFGDIPLIEIRTREAALTAKNFELLRKFITGDSEAIFIIVCGKLDYRVTKAKWCSELLSLDRLIYLPTFPLDKGQQKQWLNKRCQENKIVLDNAAREFILESCEGNLMGLADVVERLHLAGESSPWTIEKVVERVDDSSRFSTAQLMQFILQGQLDSSLKALHKLKEEGEPIFRILGFLKSELTALLQSWSEYTLVKGEKNQYSSNKRLFGIARERMTARQCSAFLGSLAEIDFIAKGGMAGIDPWEVLSLFVARFARGEYPDSLEVDLFPSES